MPTTSSLRNLGGIGRAQSKLPGPLQEVEFLFVGVISLLELFNNLCRSIRGIIVYDQDVKCFRKCKDRLKEYPDVLALLVGWNDNDRLAQCTFRFQQI